MTPVAASTTSKTVSSGLKPDWIYLVQVQGVNANGEGEPSDLIECVTAPNPPSPPPHTHTRPRPPWTPPPTPAPLLLAERAPWYDPRARLGFGPAGRVQGVSPHPAAASFEPTHATTLAR